MNRVILIAFAVCSGLLWASGSEAADYTWSGGASASWDTTATNWSGGTNPWNSTNGKSSIAVFKTNSAAAMLGSAVYANGISFEDVATVSPTSTQIIYLSGSTPTITTKTTGGGSTINATLDGVGVTGAVRFSGDSGTTLYVKKFQNLNAVTIDAGVTITGASGADWSSATNKVWTINGVVNLDNTTTQIRAESLVGSGRIMTGTANSAVRLIGLGSSTPFSGILESRVFLSWDGAHLFNFSGTNNSTTLSTFRNDGTFRISGVNAWKTNSSGVLTETDSNQGFTFELAVANQTFNTTNLSLNNTAAGGYTRFAALNADRVVTWTGNGGSATALIWGNTSQRLGDILGLGNANSTHKLTWASGIDLNGGSGATLTRTVDVLKGVADVGGEISGVISDSGVTKATLRKTGAGTLILSNSNTYTGATTITAGTLALGAAGSFVHSSAIIVGNAGSAGAVLDLTAKTGAFSLGASQLLGGGGTVRLASSGTLNVLGTFSPGNSPGLFTYEAGTTVLSGTTIMEILGTSRATDPSHAIGFYDAVDITGSATLQFGGLLKLDFANEFATNTVFDLFTAAAGSTLTGNFTGVEVTGGFYTGLQWNQMGAVWKSSSTVGGQSLEFSSATGELVIVPEPGALALAGIGLAVAGWSPWKRRRIPRVLC